MKDLNQIRGLPCICEVRYVFRVLRRTYSPLRTLLVLGLRKGPYSTFGQDLHNPTLLQI